MLEGSVGSEVLHLVEAATSLEVSSVPRVGLNLFNSHALVRISLEEAADEVFAFRRHLLPGRGREFKLSCFDYFEKLHVVLVVERGSATEENKEGNS